VGAGGLVLGHLPQRELTQRRQVSFAKEVVERLLDFFDAVDLSLAQPGAKCVDGNVDVHDFIGATKEKVRHSLAHAHARCAGDDVVQRLDVLDVDGGDD